MKRYFYLSTLAALATLTGCKGMGGNIDLHKTLGLIMILAIITLFFVLALYSNLLRDTVDCDVINAKIETAKAEGRFRFRRNTSPFSLSRVQLAVWTVIISCSYIYLAFCKGSDCPNPDINQTALILMGIGAAVTASGALIDQNDINCNAHRHQDSPSQGFFNDILTDAQGISIPRFQNVVWTGIAMTVYLTKVYMIKTGCGGLPELDSTLLSLTGISNATYLALKTQENNTPPVQPFVPPTPVTPPMPPVQPFVPPAQPVIPPAPQPVIPPVQPVTPAQPTTPPATNVTPVQPANINMPPAPIVGAMGNFTGISGSENIYGQLVNNSQPLQYNNALGATAGNVEPPATGGNIGMQQSGTGLIGSGNTDKIPLSIPLNMNMGFPGQPATASPQTGISQTPPPATSTAPPEKPAGE